MLILFTFTKIQKKITYVIQASVLTPPMFMEQEPQIPSLHDLRKVKVGSISFLILIRASNTIGPHLESILHTNYVVRLFVNSTYN